MTSGSAQPTTPLSRGTEPDLGPWERLGGAVLGAVIGAFTASLLELLWVEAAAPTALLSTFGLLAPLAAVAALAAWGASWVLHKGGATGIWAWRAASREQRVRFAAATLGAAGPVLAWLLLAAAAARSLLVGGLPALPALLLLGAVSAVLLLAAVALQQRAADALRAWSVLQSHPALIAGAGVLAPLAALIAAVQLGDTSGGGGVLGVFGVLAREELDLRGVYLLLIVTITAYQGAGLPQRRLVPIGALAAFVSAGALVIADGQMDWALALELERSAPLSGRILRPLRILSDADGDGFAAHFGGGDCDDSSADVYPGALDTPSNGVDEDCSGSDEQPAGLEPTGSAAPPVASSASSASAAATATEAPPARRRLNVVLITVDTLRWDLGYMGNQRPLSPNLDRLAARSTVYERAYSLASYTGKSVAPMLIGKYPSETHRGWMHFNRYPAQDRMLQERLQEEKLTTISVQGHWYFKENTGLGRGFDILDMSAAPKRPQGEGDKTVNSAQLTDAALAQLGKLAPEQPFFLWVHYLDPHAEYVAHEGFDFGKDARAKYDGEVAFTDHHIGRLLTGLQSGGHADSTAIVVTSDHGEAFREHGMIRHGFELWEELVRVPLLIHVPGAKPRRIAQRRGAVDLAPTIVDLALAGLPAWGPAEMSGQSLLPELFGGAPPSKDIFIDMPAGPYNGQRQAFIHGDDKLITSSMRPMGLYDLAADPGEKKNRMKDRAAVQAALDRFKAFRRGRRFVRVKPR